jgi:hypothetical protein
MFYHGYNNYIQKAFPHDELKPLSCEPRDRSKENRGHLDDILGEYAILKNSFRTNLPSFSLTLVDAMGTLLVMNNTAEFERSMISLQNTLSFDKDVTVSVFEATIRELGTN